MSKIESIDKSSIKFDVYNDVNNNVTETANHLNNNTEIYLDEEVDKTNSINVSKQATKMLVPGASVFIDAPDIISNAKEKLAPVVDATGDILKEEVTSAKKIYNYFNNYRKATNKIDKRTYLGEAMAEYNNIYLKNTATSVVGIASLVEGLADFVEAIADTGRIVMSARNTMYTGAYDGVKAIYGAATGNQWESTTKKMWENTSSNVGKKHATNLFDSMYDSNAGKSIKNNSFAYDVTRSVGNGIGYSTGIVALTLFTAGFGSTASGISAAAATSTSTMATTATIAGVGKGSEQAWSEGASVGEGLAYGIGTGAWEGAQWYIGGRINAFTPFTGGTLAAHIGNSITHVGLDSLDGGVEGFVQPALDTIYKDGYYNTNGEYIKFGINDTFTDKYSKLFDWQDVYTQATIGGIMSFGAETIDIARFLHQQKRLRVTVGEVLADHVDEVTNSVSIDKDTSYIQSKFDKLYKKNENINDVFKYATKNNYINEFGEYLSKNKLEEAFIWETMRGNAYNEAELKVAKDISDNIINQKLGKDIAGLIRSNADKPSLNAMLYSVGVNPNISSVDNYNTISKILEIAKGTENGDNLVGIHRIGAASNFDNFGDMYFNNGIKLTGDLNSGVVTNWNDVNTNFVDKLENNISFYDSNHTGQFIREIAVGGHYKNYNDTGAVMITSFPKNATDVVIVDNNHATLNPKYIVGYATTNNIYNSIDNFVENPGYSSN
ncbi:MAG: hypothetical protein IJ565_06295 [Bacilli bacterium]|nr:hypothetical protein [Bacilli bacterium]